MRFPGRRDRSRPGAPRPPWAAPHWAAPHWPAPHWPKPLRRAWLAVKVLRKTIAVAAVFAVLLVAAWTAVTDVHATPLPASGTHPVGRPG